MRILRGADDRELAAEMLNFESGARAVGPDLAPLPPPHEPFPLVDAPLVTKGGVPYQMHYRPAVGVVYYVQPVGSTLRDQAGRVKALLDDAGFQHLMAYRAVAATSAAVMRRKGGVVARTVLLTGPDLTSLITYYDGKPSARLIFCCAPGCDAAPSCSSSRAAFTWVFLPVDTAFAITNLARLEFNEIGNAVNASVAGIVHDPSRLLRSDVPRELKTLTIQDFGEAIPDSVRRTQKKVSKGLSALCGPGKNGALVFRDGRFDYLGRWAETRSKRDAARAAAGSPRVPWPADAPSQCALCDVPLSGAAMLVRGARYPALRHHQTWHIMPPSDLLELNDGAPIALCSACHVSLACVGHMGGTAVHSEIPITQSEACARVPKYAVLVPLLEGKVSPIEGVAGAFFVQHAQGDMAVVGAHRGEYPATRYEAIARLIVPVITLLNIMEEIGATR